MLKVVTEFDKHFTARGVMPKRDVKVRSVAEMDGEERNSQGVQNEVMQFDGLDMIAAVPKGWQKEDGLVVLGTKNHIYVNTKMF